MSKSKRQGTAWESQLVRHFQDQGILADRLAEGGMTDAGDVWMFDTPDREPVHVALAWKRLVKSDGGQRRVPDGEREVVVIDLPTFVEMARLADKHLGWSFVVECKHAERLNVTRVLSKAKGKLAAWKQRRAA